MYPGRAHTPGDQDEADAVVFLLEDLKVNPGRPSKQLWRIAPEKRFPDRVAPTAKKGVPVVSKVKIVCTMGRMFHPQTLPPWKGRGTWPGSTSAMGPMKAISMLLWSAK